MKVFAVTIRFDALAFHHFLDPVEHLSRNQRFVGTVMHLAEPSKVSHVDGVL